MSLVEDYNKFRDRFGLVQPEVGTTSENGVRFTGQAWIAASLQEQTDEIKQFKQSLIDAVKGCIHEDSPLFDRYPGCTTQQAWDDTISLCTIFNLSNNLLLTLEFYNYAKDHYYILNNTKQKNTWSAWLGRYPQLPPYLRHCAGLPLNIFQQLAIALGLYLWARHTDQDGKVFAWFYSRTLKGKYKLIDKAINYAESKLREHYPHGIGQVLRAYYNHDHPDCTYLWDQF